MRSFVTTICIAIARDTKNSFRIWLLNPGTTFASYAALTVGIAATTTIFSVLSSLLLSPFPVRDSDHVFRVSGLDRNSKETQISMPNALDVQREMESNAAIAYFHIDVANFGDQSRPVMVRVIDTQADLFQVMGVRMSLGAGFRPEANALGHACEVVISWPFWQTRFGGSAVVGKAIRLNERPCRIDGVLPQHLDLPAPADIWVPVQADLKVPANRRDVRYLFGIAHLKHGVDSVAFNAKLAAVCNQLGSQYPAEDKGLRMSAVPLREWLSRDVRRSLFVLLAAVSGVLLMACANVANLLLARSSARLREVSVRIAVGANRLMLIQQLMTESMVLALASSVSGLLLTVLAVRFISRLPNVTLPRPESIVVDWRVMAFALLAAGVTGLLFGCLPAVRVSMTSLTGVLSQAGGRVSDSRRQQLVRKVLVASETAIATVLLIGSLLLLHSFNLVSNVNPGFQTDHLLTAYVSLPRVRYSKDTMDTVRFAERVIERLTKTPGIRAATVATSVPLQSNNSPGSIEIEGRPAALHAGDSPVSMIMGVAPNFRQTLNIPLLAGRDLEQHDNRDEGTAVLVNRAFVKVFFPNENPLGKRLHYDPAIRPTDSSRQIVGVIGDVLQTGLEDAVKPQIFTPLDYIVVPYPAIIIRTTDDPLLHYRDIEKAVHDADADTPVFFPRTMEQVEARRLGTRSFNTALLTGFACVALLLACGGIFAVVAYSVSQRVSEIGIRMACGASQTDIVRMVIRQGMFPALLGIGVGVLLSLFLNRYLESLLFGVKTTDITAYCGAVFLLAVFSAAAAFFPARRAARVNPWRALRYD